MHVTAVVDRQSALAADWCEAGQGEENAGLCQRVGDLEFTVYEYRGQISQIFGSASWKLTSLVRISAARYRTAKFRAPRSEKRIKNGMPNRDDHNVLPACLFMTSLADLPETCPLRQRIDVNTLRRPKEADGPLHRPGGDPMVLVVAQVHQQELWGDISDRVSRMPCRFDLIATITERAAEQAIPVIVDFPPGSQYTLAKLSKACSIVRDATSGNAFSYVAVTSGNAAVSGGTGTDVAASDLMPEWDNTARRGSNSLVCVGANHCTLRSQIQEARTAGKSWSILINLWIKWAKGAATARRRKFHGGYPSAVNDALGQAS